MKYVKPNVEIIDILPQQTLLVSIRVPGGDSPDYEPIGGDPGSGV